MAKGQVSEQELSEGLASAGGLGGIVSASGARRDSPFAPSQAVRATPEPIAEDPASENRPSKPEAKTHDKAPAPTPRKPRAVRRETKPGPESAASPRPSAATAAEPSGGKARVCSESVTLPMPPELRDHVNALATRLQRTRTEKVERMTANVVMRVAIEVFLEKYDPDDAPVSNTEAGLLEAVRSRLRWG